MTRKRHNRVRKAARGYWGARHTRFRAAKDAVMRSGQFAYAHRRLRKRDFRRLWITRISAACRERGLPYSRFIAGLQRADIGLNRKVLAHLALTDGEAFDSLVQQAREALPAA